MGKITFKIHSVFRSLLLILCLLCVLVSVGLDNLSPCESGLGNSSFDPNHTGEADHDAWPRYSFPRLLVGMFLTRMEHVKPIFHSAVLIPQLPPPVNI